jgi:hypothetical protein
MGNYADKRDVVRANIKAAVGDNYKFGAFLVPANREVIFWGLKATVLGASAGGAKKVELVDNAADTTVLSALDCAATGIKTGSGTFPMRIAASTSARTFVFMTDGDPGAGGDITVELHKSYEGV